MSYTAPVLIDNNVNNTFVLGLILGFSSIIGFGADLLFSKWFHGKSFSFFLKGAMAASFLFPLVFLFLPQWVFFYLIAMIIWGIYYELINFSNYHFINTFMSRNFHAASWGFYDTVRALAYITGPTIASIMISSGYTRPLITSLIFITTSIILFWLFLKWARFSKSEHNKYTLNKVTIKQEVHIWKILFKKIWPVYLFMFTLNIMESSFWSVGTVLSEKLKSQHPMGGFLLTAFTLPALAKIFFTDKAAKRLGTKKAAFLSGILGGFFFMLSGFAPNIPLFIGVVFISSLLLTLALPEISAAFEDFVSRLDIFGNDIIGLQNSSISLAYVIGPILSGAIAYYVGDKWTFSIIGAILFVVSVFSYLIVPKRIRMPMAQLKQS